MRIRTDLMLCGTGRRVQGRFIGGVLACMAALLFASDSFAAYGIVQTLAGKGIEGELVLENGAVSVTTTNGNAEKITLAELASLRVKPRPDLSVTSTKGAGDGLNGAYFRTTDFRSPSFPRVDATVDFDWGSEAPMPGMNRDFFSVRWTGEVEAPVSGEYKFFIQTDDGGRLWVDKKLLVDQWQIVQERVEGSGTIQLERGKRYDLRMEYFNHIGTAVARLSWSPPGIEKGVVPKSHLYSRGGMVTSLPLERGLLGIYFGNADFTGRYSTRLDPSINFDWGESRPIQGIGESTFSVRWLGQVQPQFDEHYTFHTETDGRVRLWVDSRLVIDHWKDESATSATVPVQLKAGAKYDVRMEIAKTGGTAKARLFWSSPSTPRSVVPQDALFPADSASVSIAAANVMQGQRAGLAKGVLLTSGSLIAAPVQSADQSKVKFRASNGEFNVSTINVACLVFQNVPPEVASRFQGRKGVLFTNRDFVDGEFSSLQSGTAKLSSVLFGFQTYDIGSRVAAILLRDPAPGSWQYQVKTGDGSDLLVSSIKLEKDRAVIEDAALRGFAVPVSQLLEVTRKTVERTSP